MVHKTKFKIDVFSCIINIIVADDILRSINYYFKKRGEDNETGPLAGYCVRFDQEKVGEYHVFISRNWLDSNTVNHEKSHLVEFILQDRDIRASGEVRAYLDGFVSEKFNEFFKKRKLKVKTISDGN